MTARESPVATASGASDRGPARFASTGEKRNAATVAAAGAVEAVVAVDNATGNDRLAGCVADVLETIVFPERDAKTELTFPVEFTLPE